MGLMPRFTNDQKVLMELRGGYNAIEKGILKIFYYIGEEFVKDARDNLSVETGLFPKGDYSDRTANLRSSIGYFVIKDGIIVESNLQGTAEGIAAGRAVLGSIPNKTGYQLVGVAGMEYASYVESRGYNVISSQKDLAIIDLEDMIRRFKDRMNRKENRVDFDMDNLVLTIAR